MGVYNYVYIFYLALFISLRFIPGTLTFEINCQLLNSIIHPKQLHFRDGFSKNCKYSDL